MYNKEQVAISSTIDDVQAKEQEKGNTDSVHGLIEMEELLEGYNVALKNFSLINGETR